MGKHSGGLGDVNLRLPEGKRGEICVEVVFLGQTLNKEARLTAVGGLKSQQFIREGKRG